MRAVTELGQTALSLLGQGLLGLSAPAGGNVPLVFEFNLNQRAHWLSKQLQLHGCLPNSPSLPNPPTPPEYI